LVKSLDIAKPAEREEFRKSEVDRQTDDRLDMQHADVKVVA